jgi:hypothetical protein
MFQIRQILLLIYPILETSVSALRLVMPLDAVLGIIDAIEIGINQRLEADFKMRDTNAWFSMFKELSEAAVVRSEKERREAIYALLVFVTNIEERLTLEQFMQYAYSEDVASKDNMAAESEVA